ncbi:MAG: alpha-amylase/4-alpha-glucanotransferase domain-containing protein [Thermodesulfobacteriota bacterium]
MIYLPFCIHNHQPAGNFDFVLEDAYKKSYWPFLKLLHEYPAIKMTIHNTGFLLDWIVKHHPEYIEMLSIMVKRGQVEIMGGGFYEPVLAVIPDKDRAAQITMMSDRIVELFGVRPRGLWLAERVWEPTLPMSLSEAGVEYVLVDDFHFIKAGLRREELGGYYVTEDRGHVVKVFPGSEDLRYLIPFRTVEELESHLKGLKGNLIGGNAAIYGDDGEKFGVWPGTNKLVFKDGWLKRFFEMIKGLECVSPVSLGEYAASEKPLGRVYLPTCSYMEMGEWSLPTRAGRDYCRLMESLRENHTHNEDNKAGTRFIQGGTWRGFFSKYPESNWMHKRMLMASRLLGQKRAEGSLSRKVLERAARSLYKSQCNDAYWHGIFGGLYLPHLRTEVYRNIIECEALLMAGGKAGPAVESLDIDADGLPEYVITSGDSRLFINPRQGGAAFELDVLSAGLNAMNVLTRWPESYHHKIEALEEDEKSGKVESIHNAVKSKEKNIKRFLVKDSMRRGSLVDHLIVPGERPADFASGSLLWGRSFAGAPYESRINGNGAIFSRTATVEDRSFTISKEVRPNGKGGFFVRSAFCNEGAALAEGTRYGIEFNILLPGCDGPHSCFEVTAHNGTIKAVGLGEPQEFEDVAGLSVLDGFTGAAFSLTLPAAASIWSFPIYTVTLSEAGFERCFQGSSILLLFPLGSAPDMDESFEVEFSLYKIASK